MEKYESRVPDSRKYQIQTKNTEKSNQIQTNLAENATLMSCTESKRLYTFQTQFSNVYVVFCKKSITFVV